MHEKNSQFILLKIPPHVVRLLGKIHALSIEVLYNYETGSMTGILGQLKWEFLKKRRKDNRLIFLFEGLKGKASVPKMTLSPKLGVVEINTLWHFRLPLLIQMFIKVASSPRLSGIGMPFPILWSHLLKMHRIVLLSSLLWWELGTNSLITGPGEWLSFGVSSVNYPDPDPGCCAF